MLGYALPLALAGIPVVAATIMILVGFYSLLARALRPARVAAPAIPTARVVSAPRVMRPGALHRLESARPAARESRRVEPAPRPAPVARAASVGDRGVDELIRELAHTRATTPMSTFARERAARGSTPPGSPVVVPFDDEAPTVVRNVGFDTDIQLDAIWD
ncbi:MAG TPA: hypothetical protein VFQ53_30420 [Kofleriaceae bacterium]|nr:hypothetical protein [Kofleriaceae bacterium]